MRISDWSSDVCSSDLIGKQPGAFPRRHLRSGTTIDENPAAIRAQQARERFQQGGLARTVRTDDSRQHARRSEEHTSELQSLMRISYAVFCLKKKTPMLNNVGITITHT